MIEIERVSFSYTGDGETLSDISLSVGKGQCVLLCGGSGSGKTTVTKLINGLIPHFTEGGRLDGRVTAAGQVVADTELYRLAKSVGSVFQNPKSQFFNLDTDSELAFGLENEGAPPQEIERQLERTVRQLHIENLLGRNIFALSGGEKQMLAFASVYAMDPAVFVLDEPTANPGRSQRGEAASADSVPEGTGPHGSHRGAPPVFSGGSHRPGLLLPAGQAGANLQRSGIPGFVPGAESGAGAAQPDAFASGPARRPEKRGICRWKGSPAGMAGRSWFCRSCPLARPGERFWLLRAATAGERPL